MRGASILVGLLAAGGCNRDGLPVSGREPAADLAVPLDESVATDLEPPDALPDGSPPDLVLPRVVVCQSPGLQAGAPWPMVGACPDRPGRSPVLAAQSAHVRWSWKSPGPCDGGPVISADGVLYIVTQQLHPMRDVWDELLVALDAVTGTELWSLGMAQNLFGSVGSSAAIGADGTVYVGSAGGDLVAVDPATHQPRWSVSSDLNSECSSPAIAADGTIYVGNNRGTLLAVEGASGMVRFRLDQGSGGIASPAIAADGGVLFGTGGGQLRCVDGVTGKLRWSVADPSSVYGPAVGMDGTVYVGDWNGQVMAFSRTGKPRWTFHTRGSGKATPALGADGTVYAVSEDSMLYALDGATGALRWSSFQAGAMDAPPAIGGDGTVYLGSRGYSLHALDGATGTERWSLPTASGMLVQPAIGSDGTVYFGTQAGVLFAVGP